MNRADASELVALPGIERVVAERIVALREERHGFETFEELGDVPGVTSHLLANLRALLDNA